MHVVMVIVIIVAVIVFIPVFTYLRPRGPMQQRVNRMAWRQNAEGRGNLLTKPIWGKRARPPKGYDEPHE